MSFVFSLKMHISMLAIYIFTLKMYIASHKINLNQ